MKKISNNTIHPIYVDIVVPIYNADRFLKRCVFSLERQSYRYIKIILVDDGSTDKSGIICDTFKSKFDNICVIHQSNQGVSSARNAGLRVSKNKYITFVDPDDYLDKNYISTCIETAKIYNYPDLIFTPYYREYKVKSIKNNLFNTRENIFFDETSFRKNVYINIFGRSSARLTDPLIMEDLSPVWSKFYKRDIIENVYFIDMKLIGSEDLWFNINALFKVKKALYINNVYYRYVKNNSHSLTRNYKAYFEPGWEKLFKMIDAFIKENSLGVSYFERLKVRRNFSIITLLREIYGATSLKFELKIKKARSLLNNKLYLVDYNENSYPCLSYKWKIFMRLCKEKRVYLLYLIISIIEPLKMFFK